MNNPAVTLSTSQLRAVGFCGPDDSVSPVLLHLISKAYPWVEWGILFRSDLEGQPRYPSWKWVEELSSLRESGASMNLAGHLCANRCQEVLEGDSSFVSKLFGLGYRRVQVNATAANAVFVDSDKISSYVSNIKLCMNEVPDMEFIIQCNDETKPIWQELVKDAPTNMSILYDASCGKGIRVTTFPSPSVYPKIPCGYAGGIGPDSIADVLSAVANVMQSLSVKDVGPACTKGVWFDMESSLRMIVVDKKSGNHVDRFSVDNVFACIIQATQYGMPTV